METVPRLNLGVGGLGAGHPGKLILVTDVLSSDARDLMERFGIDKQDGGFETVMADDVAAGIDLTTASRGDHVMVAPSHAETLTAALALDVVGITIRGLGSGLERPTLTGNGTVDAIDITAANVEFNNFYFAGPLTDAQTSMINVSGVGAQVKNIEGLGSLSTEGVTDCITVEATADDLLLENIKLWNSDLAVNSFLSLEGAASRVTVKNFFAFGDVTTGGIIDAAKIDYLHLEDVLVGVIGTTVPAITLDSNPEGIALNVRAAGTHGTIATNCDLGNLMRIFENRVTEETDGSVQGGLIPARDTD